MSTLRLRLGLVENVGEVAAAAVLAVKVSRHENAGAAILVGALTPQTGDLAVFVNLRRRKKKLYTVIYQTRVDTTSTKHP